MAPRHEAPRSGGPAGEGAGAAHRRRGHHAEAARRRGRAAAHDEDHRRRRVRPRHQERARRMAAGPRPDRRRRGRTPDARGARHLAPARCSMAQAGTRGPHAAQGESAPRSSWPPARAGACSALQQALGVSGDGTFGPATQRALQRWQRSHGLAADGVAGPQTRARLGLGAGPMLKRKAAPHSGGSSGGSGGCRQLLGGGTRRGRGQRDRRPPLRLRRGPRLVRVLGLRLLRLGLLRAARRRAPLVAAHLGRLHELRRPGPRPAHHHLRQPGPRVHGRSTAGATTPAPAPRPGRAGRARAARGAATWCGTRRASRTARLSRRAPSPAPRAPAAAGPRPPGRTSPRSCPAPCRRASVPSTSTVFQWRLFRW